MGRKTTRYNLEIRQEEMRKRGLKEKQRVNEFFGVIRPKKVCPICFDSHFKEVPETCFKRAAKGDVSLMFEFEEYLRKNKLGRFTG